ncbi:MAG TPA: universal stress protein [Solirubrobacteraceae bacterium]|nr:universal stress protein [Solirubrobacteraceae bacterium]
MEEKIIVGTDGSASAGRAVEEAIRMAMALGAELHVVMANWSRDVPVERGLGGPVVVYGPVDDNQSAAVTDEAVARARGRGLTAEAHVVNREPADALIRLARDLGATMIVVGNKGMSGRRRLLGGVPNTISHGARCNVLIVATT